MDVRVGDLRKRTKEGQGRVTVKRDANRTRTPRVSSASRFHRRYARMSRPMDHGSEPPRLGWFRPV